MNITAYYQNVRGLRTKLNDFKCNVSAFDFDIVFITESWLNDGIFNCEILDTNEYTIFRRDRSSTESTKRDGGGVFIAVKSHLNPTLIPSFQSEAEDIWVRIVVNNIKFYLCCVYLPPGDSHARELYTSKLNDIKYSMLNETLIVVGDFNCKTVDWIPYHDNFFYPSNVDPIYENLIDTFSYLELKQYNHINNCNNRKLDLVLCTSQKIVNLRPADDPVLVEDVHHPPIEFSISCDHGSCLKSISRPFYNFKRAQYDEINQVISDIPWSLLFSDDTVDENVNMFYDILDSVIDSHVPKKYHNRRYPIYYSPETISSIKKKNKEHNKWVKYGNLGNYLEFKILRSKSKQLIRRDYRTYSATVQNDLYENPRNFFKFVRTKNNINIPKTVSYEDANAGKGKDICNLFAAYFQSVYTRPSSKNPQQEKQHINGNSRTLSFIQFSESEVEEVLAKLGVSGGVGPDGIPPAFARSCGTSLKVPLTLIFNKSLATGGFPERWKVAYTVPIHKNGSRTEVSNYRPISKLCTFEKVFESLVYPHLFFLVKSQIIREQHGFFRGRSVESNLLSFVEYLHSGLDARIQTDVVFTDFSKAFDKIDIFILLARLAGVGVCGVLLRWFESYLVNRHQIVSVEGFKSDPYVATSGVPQGSHLGPLLFLIYINELGGRFKKCRFLLFADDLKIFIRVASVQDCIDLQDDLNRLFSFCAENSLFLNASKCGVVSFTRNKHPIVFPYSIGGAVLSRMDRVRDLGVVFDSELTFNPHVEHIVNTSNKMLGFITRQCSTFTNPSALKAVYFALVFNKLNFASSIWSPTYQNQSNRLERVQKRFLRFLGFKTGYILERWNPSNYFKRLKFFEMISLEDRRKLGGLLLMKGLLSGSLEEPNVLQQICLYAPERSFRQHNLFYLPLRRTTASQNSPIFRSMRDCNDVSTVVDIFADTVRSIKRKFKTHCLESLVF